MVGIGYRLPVIVDLEWAERFALITLPNIHLLKKQRLTIVTRLKELAIVPRNRETDGGWLIELDRLAKFLVKSKYENPEDVVVWNWKDELPVDPEETFIQFYCRHKDAVFREPALVTLIWASFLKVGAEWMISKGKLWDIGVAKLSIFPLRKNWKAVLMTKYRVAKRFKAFRDDLFFNKYLRPEVVASWSETSRCIRWMIHVDESRFFDEQMRNIENERKRGLRGERGYVLRCKELLKSYEKRVREVFEAYMAQTNHKGVRAVSRKRGSGAGDHEQPVEEQGGAQSVPPSNDLNGWQSLTPVEQSKQTFVVEPDEEGLLSVSDIQSLCPHLRDGEREPDHVDPAVERGDGDARLPVLDAVQSPGESKLLPVREGSGTNAEQTLAGQVE